MNNTYVYPRYKRRKKGLIVLLILIAATTCIFLCVMNLLFLAEETPKFISDVNNQVLTPIATLRYLVTLTPPADYFIP